MFTEVLPYSQKVYEALSFLALAEAATGEPVSWDPDQPFFPLDPEDKERAAALLAPLGERPIVAIHPGASMPQRHWGADRYATLAQKIAEAGHPVVILGGPTDGRAASAIADALAEYPHVNLAGRCGLSVAAAVVAQAAVYVSADTGVLHLAYGVGTPTVHLFGSGVLEKWGPPGRRFHTIESGVVCSPCTRYGYTPPCNQGLVCMRQITPEKVFAAVAQQLRAVDTAR